jgi:outer membrane protein assembly factor BamB
MKVSQAQTLVILLAILTTTASARDWPGFRGADRTGISKEKGLLKKWPEGGPREIWSVEDLGGGFASVAIANGLIYTTGMDKNSQGTLFAFDLDGKPVWNRQYGAEWKGSHKGTRTTPTVDGDRVYIMSGQGRLACYDAKSGERKWYIDTLEKFKGKNIKWGISESVLIDGKKLICTPGGENASVVALDKMTGETIWTSKDLSELSAYCCPVIHQIGRNRVLITMLAKSIVALNPDNGDLYWQIPNEVSYDIQAVIPVYHDSMLYVTNGYGKGGRMFELSDDGTAYKLKWAEKNLDCHHGGVVLIDGEIHGSNDDGDGKKGWVRLDWQTGKVKTIDKLVGKGSVIYADGLLYCYGEKGRLGLVKITDTGYELVSSFEITKGEEEHWAHPAISNKVLYIRHGDVLMAFDIKG